MMRSTFAKQQTSQKLFFYVAPTQATPLFFFFFVKNRKKDDREGAYTSAVYPVYPPCTFSKSESEFREGRALL